MQFLELIEYNVSVTASLYASYYFELRTLCEKADAARGQSGHLRGPQLATWVSSDCIRRPGAGLLSRGEGPSVSDATERP